MSDAAAIRAARDGDEAFILGLADRFTAFELPAGRDRDGVTQAIAQDLREHLRERPRHSSFFIVELDGKAAGFLHLQWTDDFFGDGQHAHISDLAIAPGFEGRGLAGGLLAHAEAQARAEGCTRLTLSVFPGNARARALYERHGFGLDLLRMGKPLGG